MTAPVQHHSEAFLTNRSATTGKYCYRVRLGSKTLTVLSALFLLSAGAFLTLSPSQSVAETLAMPKSEANSYTHRPQRGITKAEVESRFGAPLSKNGPRGNPAIYYWEYPEHTVYFENNIVIHSVSKEKSLKPQY